MFSVSTDEDGKTYRVRLNGTPFNLLLVGAVNYLNNHPTTRAVAGTIGIMCLVLGGIANFIPMWEFEKATPPLLIFGVFSAFTAILATQSFHLYIGDPIEVTERREAEQHIKD